MFSIPYSPLFFSYFALSFHFLCHMNFVMWGCGWAWGHNHNPIWFLQPKRFLSSHVQRSHVILIFTWFTCHMLLLFHMTLEVITCYFFITWLSCYLRKSLGPITYNLTKVLLFAFSRFLRVYKPNFFNPLFSSFLSFLRPHRTHSFSYKQFTEHYTGKSFIARTNTHSFLKVITLLP